MDYLVITTTDQGFETTRRFYDFTSALNTYESCLHENYKSVVLKSYDPRFPIEHGTKTISEFSPKNF